MIRLSITLILVDSIMYCLYSSIKFEVLIDVHLNYASKLAKLMIMRYEEFPEMMYHQWDFIKLLFAS